MHLQKVDLADIPDDNHSHKSDSLATEIASKVNTELIAQLVEKLSTVVAAISGITAQFISTNHNLINAGEQMENLGIEIRKVHQENKTAQQKITYEA